MQSTEQLQDLLRRTFPAITYGFAYGSAVFRQAGLYQDGSSKDAGPMIDMIFVVDDPQLWHQQNIALNRRHYSFLATFGPRAVCTVADSIGVGVYFNTLVPLGQQFIKYGVVGTSTFLSDLQRWDHLYVSGRLHKPVLNLVGCERLAPVVHSNLQSAVAAALLLSPEHVSFKELFKRITALSYMGDVRMGLAEDSKKVERIVQGSYDHFQQLYCPVLQDQEMQQWGFRMAEPDVVQQDTSADARTQLLSRLPQTLLQHVAACVGCVAGGSALADNHRLDIAHAAVKSRHYQRAITSGLHAIVAASSRRQAAAGLLSAGLRKSAVYLGRKIAKAWR